MYIDNIQGRIFAMKKWTNDKTIWRLLVLDVSEMYTKIYDEIYGDDPELLTDLLDVYSDKKNINA